MSLHVAVQIVAGGTFECSTLSDNRRGICPTQVGANATLGSPGEEDGQCVIWRVIRFGISSVHVST
jgi:hypothetical protein